VIDVQKSDGLVWHRIEGPLPAIGAEVHGEIDWTRRHALMRTHSSLHVLGGVIWNEWRVAATGNNMTPLSARIDYEFDPLPDAFAARLEELIAAEIAADRPIVVSFLPRGVTDVDPELIRTKANLIPESVTEVRIVDIVGLDKQADGGTHVRSTGEIGRVAVTKTESKGKGNKRIRIEVRD
jgi:misacylated tRNA(Ala) deacylase